MTSYQLYALCDNRNHMSYLTIRHNKLILDEGNYTYLHSKWGDIRIIGFRIYDDMHVTIYV